jgi:tetratricopeptide (TPR) repeat protein
MISIAQYLTSSVLWISLPRAPLLCTFVYSISLAPFTTALFGNIERDLNDAISHQLKAIELVEEDHAALPQYLCNLAIFLFDRFKYQRARDVGDVGDAVTHMRRAVVSTPDDHSSLPDYYSKLGRILSCRFDYQDAKEDIEEALTLHRLAVELSRADDVALNTRRRHLANSLQSRFCRFDLVTDLEEAIRLL